MALTTAVGGSPEGVAGSKPREQPGGRISEKRLWEKQGLVEKII